MISNVAILTLQYLLLIHSTFFLLPSIPDDICVHNPSPSIAPHIKCPNSTLHNNLLQCSPLVRFCYHQALLCFCCYFLGCHRITLFPSSLKLLFFPAFLLLFIYRLVLRCALIQPNRAIVIGNSLGKGLKNYNFRQSVGKHVSPKAPKLLSLLLFLLFSSLLFVTFQLKMFPIYEVFLSLVLLWSASRFFQSKACSPLRQTIRYSGILCWVHDFLLCSLLIYSCQLLQLFCQQIPLLLQMFLYSGHFSQLEKTPQSCAGFLQVNFQIIYQNGFSYEHRMCSVHRTSGCK